MGKPREDQAPGSGYRAAHSSAPASSVAGLVRQLASGELARRSPREVGLQDRHNRTSTLPATGTITCAPRSLRRSRWASRRAAGRPAFANQSPITRFRWYSAAFRLRETAVCFRAVCGDAELTERQSNRSAIIRPYNLCMRRNLPPGPELSMPGILAPVRGGPSG